MLTLFKVSDCGFRKFIGTEVKKGPRDVFDPDAG